MEQSTSHFYRVGELSKALRQGGGATCKAFRQSGRVVCRALGQGDGSEYRILGQGRGGRYTAQAGIGLSTGHWHNMRGFIIGYWGWVIELCIRL